MRLLLALALALSLPACASAAGGGADATGGKDWDPHSVTGKTEYWRKGYYGAVGLVQGFEHFNNVPAGASARDSDLGFTLRGGWRVDKDIAVEILAEDETGFGVRAPGPGGGTANLDLWSFGVQGKFYFADQRLEPYGLVGIGGATASGDRGLRDGSGAFVRIGGGAEYYLKKDVALFAEASFNRMTGNLKNYDHVNLAVGVLVRF